MTTMHPVVRLFLRFRLLKPEDLARAGRTIRHATETERLASRLRDASFDLDERLVIGDPDLRVTKVPHAKVVVPA